VQRPAGVPDGALVSLYRVEPDREHAAPVTVRLGRGSAREVEIVSGAAEGDELVVSDTSSWDAHGRVRFQ
jgi:hypothetical protein